MYITIQFSVYCYMFRQNPAAFWQSLHQYIKPTEVKISPITGPRCPEGSRKFRFPDYVTTTQDGGKGVSLTHRPFLPPRNTGDTHFCCNSLKYNCYIINVCYNSSKQETVLFCTVDIYIGFVGEEFRLNKSKFYSGRN